MEPSPDAIVAIATAPLPSGIGIVRVSGQKLGALCQALTGNPRPAPRQATLRSFFDVSGQVIDQGLLLYFPAPASFTGEEVLEFQAHGSPVVLHELQAHALACGARLAQPGEFTLRAYLNHRLDLNQAEAVADLIHAESGQAAASAARALNGVFSREIEDILGLILHHRIFLESHFDFSDEDIPAYQQATFRDALVSLAERLARLMGGVKRGLLLRQGKKVVLVGVPNVGKSSLLNRLTEEDHALVTPIPGTTRDIIKGYLVIQGVPVHLIDTAGIRDTVDSVEQAGIQRTWQAALSADLVLIVADIRTGLTEDDRIILEKFPKSLCKLLIFNKIDAINQNDVKIDETSFSAFGAHLVKVSAHTGEGIEALKQGIIEALQMGRATDSSAFMVGERHWDSLRRAHEAMISALNNNTLEEFLAEDLHGAQQSLLEITGREYASDDLLGEIFSKFCIGK